MLSAREYVKLLLAVGIAALCIWVAITGRLGSLLGALLIPGFMTEGTPPAPGSAPLEQSDPNAKITGSGSTLTMLQIGAFAYGAGVTTQGPLAIAIAIAMAESGGRVGAQNPSGAAGLWQILPSAHPGYNVQQLLSSPSYNASAMFAISNGGTNWNPWQTYTNGNYKQFLAQATTAAAQAIAANQGKG